MPFSKPWMFTRWAVNPPPPMTPVKPLLATISESTMRVPVRPASIETPTDD